MHVKVLINGYVEPKHLKIIDLFTYTIESFLDLAGGVNCQLSRDLTVVQEVQEEQEEQWYKRNTKSLF